MTPNGIGGRSDLRSVNVTIDNEDTGTWDMVSGGEGDSEETKYREGGAGKQINLGGPSTRENLTVARLLKLDRDLPKIKTWDGKRGRAEVVVTQLFLDRDKNVASTGLTYKGILKRVAVPEHDSENTDAVRVTLEVSLDADSLS